MKREEQITIFQKYIGRRVKIGIPHYTQPRLFYHEGKLVAVEGDYLILTDKQSIKRINISDVIEFTLIGGGYE
jgi:ribosome maturation factor RimP